MIPAAFEYHRPTTVQDALRLLQTLPDAKLLAGGHSLLPAMKLRLATPAHLIDLGRIGGLRHIRDEGPTVVLGALATHWMVESSDVVRRKIPPLAEAASRIGDVQVRNMGTIGGSLAHADPAADYPAAILALEAELVAQGSRGRRTIAAREFFTGLFATALSPDEILVEVRVPVPTGRTGSAYLKFPHPASGFAVVGVAALVELGRGNTCKRARVGITGVGSAAYRATGTEDLLAGKLLDDATIASAANHATDGVDANDDIFASAEYRRHLTRVFTKRAIREALSRVGG